MHNVLLFNTGFRSECVCEALRRYKGTGEPITPRTLDDSLELIRDCFSFRESVTSFFSSNGPGFSELLPLVFDLFPGKSPEQIGAELKALQSVLDRVGQGEKDVDVDSAITFFFQISRLCLRRNAQALTSFSPFQTLAV